MSEEKNWLEKITHWFDRIPGNKGELIELLREIKITKIIDSESLAMIEGVLQVSQLTAAQIMVPRAQMVFVDESENPEAFLQRIKDSGHSRFPVFDAAHEQVRGCLLAKDLLQLLIDPSANKSFQFDEYIRPALVIPETKRLDSLLQEFKRSHQHLAIVVDEYGSIIGLVTIEDVLEQIVGEIDDEHDTDEGGNFVKTQADGSVVVKAIMPLKEFNEYFHTNFDLKKAETIGGLLLSHWHHLPRQQESLTLEGLTFTVIRADHRRIHLLAVQGNM